MEVAAWHSLTVPDAIERLRSSLRGLSAVEAYQRLKEVGPNTLAHRGPPSAVRVFARQFWSPLVGILVAAALISWFVRERTDAAVIAGVVLFNALVGFWQERKANEALERLRSLTPHAVHVLRDGLERIVPAADVVPGDVVVLESGTLIPADGRLVEAVNLKLNEAVFTGESLPVEKTADVLPETTPLVDRRNSAWRGTTVVAGRGQLLVGATGRATRFGSILATAAQVKREGTPFQRGLAVFAKRLTVVIFAAALVVFAVGVLRALPPAEVFLLSVALVVSLVPEGLPVVITLALAWGMWRLSQRRALVRQLTAVETLGSVTTIAADKTGTLTVGQMMVEAIVADRATLTVTGEGYARVGDFFRNGQPADPLVTPDVAEGLRVGVLCNDARFAPHPQGGELPIGDPTELALLVVAEKAGLTVAKLREQYPRVGEFPFDFRLRYMVTIHRRGDGRQLVAVKGAPRQVLELCRSVSVNGVSLPFSEDAKERARASFEQLAQRGLRGLALASALVEEDVRTLQDEHLRARLTFLGLVGMRDAIRPEARDTIAQARQAGIRVLMLTGDYRVTAETVAREIGLLGPAPSQAALDGRDLAALNDAELSERLPRLTVLSRVAPEDKLRVAKLLKGRGEVVAMTGDGINDVPALAEADVGVAVGADATDAAKEAADILLTDGNLSSLVAAVSEGRTIYANIQRVLHYLLASNAGGLLLILGALAAGLPLPLLPTQIIWLNAVTDPFLGLALAREPEASNVLHVPPRPAEQPIVAAADWRTIAAVAVAMTLGTFGAFLAEVTRGAADAHRFAVTLTALALNEWLSAFIFRSPGRSLVEALRANRWLPIGFAVVVLLQILLLYWPTVAAVFHVVPLSVTDWLIVLAAALPLLLAAGLTRPYRHAHAAA